MTISCRSCGPNTSSPFAGKSVTLALEASSVGASDRNEEKEKAGCGAAIVLSERSQGGEEEESGEEEDAPPKDDLVAWLQVLGCFALFFNTWYVVNFILSPFFPFLRSYSCLTTYQIGRSDN